MDKEIIRQIRERLEEYLLQKGIPLRKNFQCLNPAHEDSNPSMCYYRDGKNVHCFSCGATYDIFDLIGLDYHLSDFASQFQKACHLFGFASSKPPAAPAVVPAPAPADRGQELAQLRARSNGEMSYFYARGITEDSCQKYGLFQAGERAYFPIWEAARCTGWVGRGVLEEVRPKYKNSPGPIGVWNGGLLQQEVGGDLYVTEGIIDAICLEQLGRQAMALCGSQNISKFLTLCQESRRTSNLFRFVICGDPDAAGQKMNESLCSGLKELGFTAAVLELSPEDGDIGALYLSNRMKLEAALEEVQFPDEAAAYSATAAASSLDLFFAEAKIRAAKGAVSSGFSALDQILDGGFYPGLYILGAISSLGKTSFILQIADHIAEAGHDVLFFSLEQSRFELIAKSLSRTSALLDQEDRKNAFTARQLLSGRWENTLHREQFLNRVQDRYRQRGANIFLAEGVADIGAEEIRQWVSRHLRHRRPPVVFIDYLQILKASDARMTDKQNVDRAVVELKRISRDFDIPVIAVSSFNRENYRVSVSMEAFKESGAVEYSSDVLFGLQLLGAGTKEFDYNAEKARDPRRVELVMLKNRNGIPYAKIGFKYYAKFNLFEETGQMIR